MGTTSKTLLARLKDGSSPDDWGRFVERYWRLIYWVARRAGLGTEKEVLDVVRDAMESKLSEEEDRRISGKLKAIAPPASETGEN